MQDNQEINNQQNQQTFDLQNRLESEAIPKIIIDLLESKRKRCFYNIEHVRDLLETYYINFIQKSEYIENDNIKAFELSIRKEFLDTLKLVPELLEDNQFENIKKICDAFYPIINKMLNYNKNFFDKNFDLIEKLIDSSSSDNPQYLWVLKLLVSFIDIKQLDRIKFKAQSQRVISRVYEHFLS